MDLGTTATDPKPSWIDYPESIDTRFHVIENQANSSDGNMKQ